jgi:hypothetical protein
VSSEYRKQGVAVNILWTCPLNAHAAVKGPSRPRRDNLCRYCIECSKGAGKLVRRVSPKLEKKRAARSERRNEKKRQSRIGAHARRAQADVNDLFRCGLRATGVVRPTTGTWLGSLHYIEVRQSLYRRATLIEERGVVIYDFDGCDPFDARALVCVAVARWDARIIVADNIKRLRIRGLSTYMAKVTPRLEGKAGLRDAEIEVSDLLRKQEAVRRMETG